MPPFPPVLRVIGLVAVAYGAMFIGFWTWRYGALPPGDQGSAEATLFMMLFIGAPTVLALAGVLLIFRETALVPLAPWVLFVTAGLMAAKAGLALRVFPTASSDVVVPLCLMWTAVLAWAGWRLRGFQAEQRAQPTAQT